MKRTRRVIPAAMRKLARALREEFDAEVEVDVTPGDAVTGDRFRLAVVSPRFRRMHHLKRQDLIWDVVDKLLTREEAFSISMMLAYSPNELDLGRPRRKTKRRRPKATASR